MRFDIETIIDDHNLCGEGPLWDWRRERLVWNDLSASLVFEYCPATRTRTVISRGLMAAGMALHGLEGFIFAGASGLHIWQGPDDYTTVVPGNVGCFNDIVVDSAGRIYAGTLYWEATEMVRSGELLLIDTDGSVRVVDEGVHLANGLALSPDESTLYFADSAKRQIAAYDVDRASGALSNKRVFADTSTDEGLPDGIVVDAEGGVWCALWYGGQIVRYDPAGNVERRIRLPVPQVTSVEFGGPDLADLYVTSAAEPWPTPLIANYGGDLSALGGALYRVTPGVRGRRRQPAGLARQAGDAPPAAQQQIKLKSVESRS